MSRATSRFAREVSSVPTGGMQSFATAPSRSRGSTPSRMAPDGDGGVEQGLEDRTEGLLEVRGQGIERRVAKVQRGSEATSGHDERRVVLDAQFEWFAGGA